MASSRIRTLRAAVALVAVVGLVSMPLPPAAAQSGDEVFFLMRLTEMAAAQSKGDCDAYAGFENLFSAPESLARINALDNGRAGILTRLAAIRARGCTPAIVYATGDGLTNSERLERAAAVFHGESAGCDFGAFQSAKEAYAVELDHMIEVTTARGVDRDLNQRLRRERIRVELASGVHCDQQPEPMSAPVTEAPRSEQNDDPLGTEWSESESGWSGRWIRRGSSNTFDAIWNRGGEEEVKATLTIDIAGNRVTVERVNASDGNSCQYEGTLSDSSVSGTYRCTSSGAGRWSATIRNERTQVATSAALAPADAEWEDIDDLDLSGEPALASVTPPPPPSGTYNDYFAMWDRVAGTEGTPAEQLQAARNAATRCNRAGFVEIVKSMRELSPLLERALADYGTERQRLTEGYDRSIVARGRDDQWAALNEVLPLTLSNCVAGTVFAGEDASEASVGNGPLTEAALELLSAAATEAERCNEPRMLRHVGDIADLLQEARRLLGQAEPNSDGLWQAFAEARRVNKINAWAQEYEPANCPPGGAGATAVPAAERNRLEALVAADSQGWRSNKYVAGSMTNVRVVEGDLQSGTYALRGDYSYNQSAQGWVIAKFKGGRLDCLQYHDIGQTCRAPN